MAMFPDSGVPPSDAKNSLPDVDTTNQLDELWYSTSRCQPRFDPAAANAMLAEEMNLVMRGEVTYNGLRLDNIELAVRYLIQRGLPSGGVMNMGPLDYTLALDPPLTRYNDHLSLIVVPTVANSGATRVDVNTKGLVPILRNDAQELRAKDLKSKIPTLISYWNGNFYVISFVQSQVPLLGGGAIDGWIRTDGNDQTGDGTANTAAKAFRTVNGAFQAIGTRYVQTPGFQITLRLGIPGDYEAVNIGNGNNAMTLIGLDGLSPASYRIKGLSLGTAGYSCAISDTNNMSIQGVTFLMDQPGVAQAGLACARSTVNLKNCIFRQTVYGPDHSAIVCGNGRVHLGGAFQLIGAGPMACLYNVPAGIVVADGSPGGYQWTISNVAFTSSAIAVYNLGLVYWGPQNPVLGNVTGQKFAVQTNAILNSQGAVIPGTLPGVVGTGGQVL